MSNGKRSVKMVTLTVECDGHIRQRKFPLFEWRALRGGSRETFLRQLGDQIDALIEQTAPDGPSDS